MLMNGSNKGKTKKSGKGRIPAALVLAAALTLGIVLPAFAADSLEKAYDEGFSVTVNVPEGTLFEGLEDAGATVDIYRIAEAKPKESVDSFDLVWDETFADGEAAWKEIVEKANAEGKDPVAADVDALSQTLAKKVLANVPEYSESEDPEPEEEQPEPDFTGELGKEIALVKDDGIAAGGLYLIIVHGNLNGYKFTDSDGNVSTVAKGTASNYRFAPILATVPMRAQKEIGEGSINNEDGDAIGSYTIGYGHTTAPDEVWVNKLEITAKAAATDQTAPLKITKNLLRFEHVEGRVDPVTVIYDVVITYKDEVIKSGLVTIVFTDMGTKSEVIEGLPIGATAVVTEIYRGANYMPIGDEEVTVEIIADDPKTDEVEMAEAEFTNSYEKGIMFGTGSVRNHFEADGEGEWTSENSYKIYADGLKKSLSVDDITPEVK